MRGLTVASWAQRGRAMPQGGMRTSQKLQRACLCWGQGTDPPGTVLRKAGGGEDGDPVRYWTSVPFGGPGGH